MTDRALAYGFVVVIFLTAVSTFFEFETAVLGGFGILYVTILKMGGGPDE